MSKWNQHFVEHLKTRSVPPPAILYKYMSAETAIRVLSGQRLRFQSPLRYNDPLDSQWDPLWPLFTDDSREYERSLVEQSLRDPSSWPADADYEFRDIMGAARRSMTLMPAASRDAHVADIATQLAGAIEPSERLLELLHDIRRRMRIFCLSETDRSILMWSHYADQHRGVVLGFQSTELESFHQRPLERISYAEGPPRLFDPKEWIRKTFFGLPDHGELESRSREWGLTKHTDWSYEREWRFVWIIQNRTTGDFTDISFPGQAVAELVVGCRTDPGRIAEISTLARTVSPGARCFTMSIHPSKFELVKAEMLPDRSSSTSQ